MSTTAEREMGIEVILVVGWGGCTAVLYIHRCAHTARHVHAVAPFSIPQERVGNEREREKRKGGREREREAVPWFLITPLAHFEDIPIR